MGRRGVTVSHAEFRRMWSDPALTLPDLAARLGVTAQAVSARAKARGLPARGCGGTRFAKAAIEDILPMWRAMVTTDDIGRHFGCRGGAIRLRMKRAGITRPACHRHNSLPLAEWYARQMAERMARAAAVTRAVMAEAGMMERPAGRPRKAA